MAMTLLAPICSWLMNVAEVNAALGEAGVDMVVKEADLTHNGFLQVGLEGERCPSNP